MRAFKSGPTGCGLDLSRSKPVVLESLPRKDLKAESTRLSLGAQWLKRGSSGNRMPNEVNGLYEFGSFRLNAANRLLSHAGETVTLAPKTLDLLLLLVDGEGRVLTKRELMNALWADTFVEEASLSYQIAALRKALGKEGDEWIETVPKHAIGSPQQSPRSLAMACDRTNPLVCHRRRSLSIVNSRRG